MPEVNLNIVERLLKFLSNVSPDSSVGKFESILGFIMRPELPGWVLIFKILSIIISLFFLWVIYRGVFKSTFFKCMITWKYGDFFAYGGKMGKTKGIKRWENVKKRVDAGKESELKLAIMEADSLLEETLTKMGFIQPTIEEKIRKVGPEVITNIETLINVRQIRNNIVSDPDYKINIDETKKVLDIYEASFKNIQLL